MTACVRVKEKDSQNVQEREYLGVRVRRYLTRQTRSAVILLSRERLFQCEKKNISHYRPLFVRLREMVCVASYSVREDDERENDPSTECESENKSIR